MPGPELDRRLAFSRSRIKLDVIYPFRCSERAAAQRLFASAQNKQAEWEARRS